jgi:DNA-directed RNA polymerase subunit M/transcription elongation factor TFIIS
MVKYCPDCIEKLVINRKKLGDLSVWWVCPKCGYRTRTSSIEWTEHYAKENLIKERKIINESNYFKEI